MQNYYTGANFKNLQRISSDVSFVIYVDLGLESIYKSIRNYNKFFILFITLYKFLNTNKISNFYSI